MTFSRLIQAAIPLLLSPLVILWLDSSGNDKAMAFSIPWMAFSAVYLIVFLLLSRPVKSTFLLTLFSAAISVAVGAFGVSYLVISYLKAHQGT